MNALKITHRLRKKLENKQKKGTEHRVNIRQHGGFL